MRHRKLCKAAPRSTGVLTQEGSGEDRGHSHRVTHPSPEVPAPPIRQGGWCRPARPHSHRSRLPRGTGLGPECTHGRHPRKCPVAALQGWVPLLGKTGNVRSQTEMGCRARPDCREGPACCSRTRQGGAALGSGHMSSPSWGLSVHVCSSMRVHTHPHECRSGSEARAGCTRSQAKAPSLTVAAPAASPPGERTGLPKDLAVGASVTSALLRPEPA